METSILIVDDEWYMLDLLTMILEEEFQIMTTSDGKEALELLSTQKFDLCLLDIMMPWIDGFEIVKQLKHKGITTPIIFISARTDLEDRVEGLELGADDYITKPFEPAEVVARVISVLRRTKRTSEEYLNCSSIHVDMSAREVWVKGKEIKLTRIEYELLITLLRKPNQAFSREQLIQNIWDYEFHGDVRTIDSHIKNLRYKLREVELQDRVIQTVWGYGYKWGVR
jgi:two-component system response regulator ResD